MRLPRLVRGASARLSLRRTRTRSMEVSWTRATGPTSVSRAFPAARRWPPTPPRTVYSSTSLPRRTCALLTGHDRAPPVKRACPSSSTFLAEVRVCSSQRARCASACVCVQQLTVMVLLSPMPLLAELPCIPPPRPPMPGFTQGNAQLDATDWIVASNHSLVIVIVQYRLGALGFLPAASLQSAGLALNVGLLDQRMALRFVRRHIPQFGGDPSRVTLAGQSAGGGSVILHAHSPRSRGLFHRVAAMSPFLPHIYRPSDSVPQWALAAVLNATNCTYSHESVINSRSAAHGPVGQASASTLLCLQSASTQQVLSGSLAAQMQFPLGLGGWLPVQDNDTVLVHPLRATASSDAPLHGAAVMVGHNAEDGPALVTQQVSNSTSLNVFLRTMFPRLGPAARQEVLDSYPVDPAVEADYATDGLTQVPFASSVNSAAHGWQAAADLMYGEAFVACPAYWLANSFAERRRPAWVYQYSIVPAYHGADMNALWSNVVALMGPTVDPRRPDWLGEAFKARFKDMWTRFVHARPPWLPGGSGNQTDDGSWGWPGRRGPVDVFLNLNQTGGTEVARPFFSATANVSYLTDPGLTPTASSHHAQRWERDRYARCALWARLIASSALS